MAKVLFLALAIALAGCTGEAKPGTVINNSGDDNVFSTGSNGAITSPTPVVVPPVVINGEPTEPE